MQSSAGQGASDASVDEVLTGKDRFDIPVAPAIDPWPRFSPKGGGFVGQQTVTLTPPSDDGTIFFTLDGSEPNENSTIYEQPIELSQTAILRAMWVEGDLGLPPVYGAQSYVALEPSAADFTSNLPIVVIERHGDEPVDPDRKGFRVSSALFFEPTSSGRTAINATAALCARAGVRVRGETSRTFVQKSWAVELWEAGRDNDHQVPVLGMPAESDWVLLAPGDFDRSLMRTMLPMDLSRFIGVYAPRTRFVEVFVVDRPGSQALSLSDYLGVYTFTAKIKRDPQRVNVAKIGEDDVTGDAVTGGYVFRIDKGEPDFSSGGYGFQWVYPEPEDMLLDPRKPQVDYLVGYLGDFLEALRSDGFVNPRTGLHYTDMIDRAQWIDHNLLVALTKNIDGLRFSAYFSKQRNGPLVAGPIWDFDRSMGTPYDEIATAPDEWASGEGTRPLEQLFWGDLFADPEFERAYWERWHELVEGPFGVASLLARIDDYESELLEARQRHFQRFPEYETEGGPAAEVQLLRDWFRARVEWVSEQSPL